MLNLFDFPMNDREGFIEQLERLEEKTKKEMMDLTTFDTICFIRSQAMDMQGPDPLPDVLYLHKLYERWEVLQEDRETLENKAVSEILEEIHAILKFYSLPFGGIELVHAFCENAMREAMD